MNMSNKSEGGRTEDGKQNGRNAGAGIITAARTQITEQVDRKSTEIGERVASAAEAVRGVGRQLREQEQSGVANLTDRVADRVEGLAGYLSNGTPDQILRDIKDLAAREPMLFAGACFAVGMLAARIVKAATSGTESSSGDGAGATAATAGSTTGSSAGSTTGSTAGSTTGSSAGSTAGSSAGQSSRTAGTAGRAAGTTPRRTGTTGAGATRSTTTASRSTARPRPVSGGPPA